MQRLSTLLFSTALLGIGFAAGTLSARNDSRPAARLAVNTGAAVPPSSAPAAGPLEPVPVEARRLSNQLVGLEESIDCAKKISDAFEALSDVVSPSVVSVTSHVRGFGSTRQLAQGSGAVISEDGLVVTNNHVVDGGETYRATFTDGREIEARLIGRDPASDLAFLELDGGGFDALDIADRRARVGEFVLAIGNPLGIGHTVSSGIVSALGRQNLNIATYEDFIQTNAEINPGNSGGPLINLEGEVLGINTAIGIGRGGPQGISFAIPTSMVRTVMEDVVEYGYVRRGFLGVQTADYRPTSRRSSWRTADIVVVREVTPSSPAQAAGIRSGDVVLEIGGQKIGSSNELLKAIARYKPGETVDVLVERDGREVTVSPKLVLRRLEQDD